MRDGDNPAVAVGALLYRSSMAKLIIAAILTLLGGVALKMIELNAEGRGSWRRRAITSDVALYNALPKHLRSGSAGAAVATRIEAGVLALYAGPVQHGKPQTANEVSRTREFQRELEKVETRMQLWFVAILAAVAAVFLASPTPAGSSDVPLWRVVPVSIVPTLGLIWAVRRIAVHRVRTRWRRRGWQIPAKYA